MVGRHTHRRVYRELLASGEFWTFFVGAILIPAGLALGALKNDWWTWGPFSIPQALLLASVALNGVPIIIGAFKGLMARELNVDELVAIALIACLASAEWFEAATVAAIMKLGSLVEETVSNQARNAIKSLVNLNPATVVLRQADGSEVSVDRAQVQAGDLVVHRPGDVIAVDGVIVQGKASVDEASLTGESVPVNRTEGHEVSSGTINLDGLLLVRALRRGEDSTLSRIIALVQAAEDSKVKGSRLVDRFAKWFTPTILVLAGLTWLITGDWERAITVLIVGCPCSFLLSGPIPTAAAIGRAARLGIMVKDGLALEDIARANEWYFDKTGTLTAGEPRVASLTPQRPATAGEVDQWLAWAAAVESGSEHPLGKAVVQEARHRELTIPLAQDITAVPGVGIHGRVAGHRVELAAWDGSDSPQGSPVMLKLDGQDSLVFSFHDPERGSATNLASTLRAQGASQVGLLSGDHHGVVHAMGRRLGLDQALGRQTPGLKQQHLQDRQDQGAVTVFVGDGLNDAPALATARIGIAMGSRGVDAALDTSDVVLMNDQIHLLPFLQRLGRRMGQIIQANILLSFSINLLSIILAFSGMLSPVLGAITHNIGSVLVVSISATLGLMRPPQGVPPHGTQ